MTSSASDAGQSKFVREIRLSSRDAGQEYLLGPESDPPVGAVLLACCGDGT